MDSIYDVLMLNLCRISYLAALALYFVMNAYHLTFIPTVIEVASCIGILLPLKPHTLIINDIPIIIIVQQMK